MNPINDHISFIQNAQIGVFLLVLLVIGYKLSGLILRYFVIRNTYEGKNIKENIQQYLEDKTLEKRLNLNKLKSEATDSGSKGKKTSRVNL